MGDLTRKTQILEIELDKTTKQLQQVTAKATEETLKCNTAKEVIKSLTAQVNIFYGLSFCCALLLSTVYIYMLIVFSKY